MRRNRKRQQDGPPSTGPLPVLNDRSSALPRRRNYARWRAVSLSLVYVLFAAHIIHWKLTGTTLAPLELNEVMYTLELGIITAGFLFMTFLFLGTLVFGRFFCSWACHIMVLQDLCGWLLRKLGMFRKPIRSRLLLFVPTLTALYMFVWPQLVRVWESRAFPTFHLATDRDGWASFVTNSFWRNLPSAPIIVLTFVVCGFVMVYLLGSRTFCAYVCPYGAIFALADRFAPGKILGSDACQQCARCTAACTTGIRVHEEIKRHQMVVNPACLKDLDCVSACPQQALRYGFSKPALFKSDTGIGRFGLPYDFSWPEELLAASVFVTVLLSFRGLYSRVPFLLSLACAGIIGYLAIVTVRMFVRSNVTVGTIGLKRLGRITVRGRAFGVFMVLLTAFIAHSAFVRYHEYAGLKQAQAYWHAEPQSEADVLAAGALTHLQTADRWGLMNNQRAERSLVRVAAGLNRMPDVEAYARRLLGPYPRDLDTRLHLARTLGKHDRAADAEREFQTIILLGTRDVEDEGSPALRDAHLGLGELLAGQRRFVEAEGVLRGAIALDTEHAGAHAQLGSVLAELGRLDEAVVSLSEAVGLEPRLGQAHYNLGAVLGRLRRYDEAISSYEQALVSSADDSDLHNNLGYALLRTGQIEKSRRHLERAVALNPGHAGAHLNLGILCESLNQLDQAGDHYRIAARLDPRIARLLSSGRSQ